MARRPAAILTNAHADARPCVICAEPVLPGQGAYVTTDGRRAWHYPCPPIVR